MSQSEVARIRAQIELECEAMERGFRGYAIVARHDFINHKLSKIAAHQEQLGAVGWAGTAFIIRNPMYRQMTNNTGDF